MIRSLIRTGADGLRPSAHRPSHARRVIALGGLVAFLTLLAGPPAAAIIGGLNANLGEYPAMAFLLVVTDQGNGQCGGTLVGSRRVLTAAHCAVDSTGNALPPANFNVVLGLVDIRQPWLAANVYFVSAVDVHEGYDPATSRNDVAMLTLDRRAPFVPLRVVAASETAKWAPGTTALITGWGTEYSGGNTIDDLKAAQYPIITDSSCAAVYGTAFDSETMVCAADSQPPHHGFCQGDSGGPLMVSDGGDGLLLAGIMSWGIGCADLADGVYPDVHTRLGAPALNTWVSARISTVAPPTGLLAGATSETNVSLAWNVTPGAHHYEIARRSPGNAAYLTISSNVVGTAYADTTVVAGHTYVYVVRAVDAEGVMGSDSGLDAATTILFTDDPLTAGTVIRAIHFAELRQAVNVIWATAGLGAATFTDGMVAGLFVKALHINELRASLNAARSSLGLAPATYTDAPLSAGSTVVKRVHVVELRNAVK